MVNIVSQRALQNFTKQQVACDLNRTVYDRFRFLTENVFGFLSSPLTDMTRFHAKYSFCVIRGLLYVTYSMFYRAGELVY